MSPKLQSILLGAATVALLSMSYLSFINCLCCAGVIAGALVTVWHYTSTNELTIAAGEGAVMGLSAAALGGFISIFINFVLIKLGIRYDLAFSQFILDTFRDQMPPEQIEAMEDQMDAAVTFGAFFLNGLIGVVIYIVFGAIGGAIGASVFKKGKDTPGAATA